MRESICNGGDDVNPPAVLVSRTTARADRAMIWKAFMTIQRLFLRSQDKLATSFATQLVSPSKQNLLAHFCLRPRNHASQLCGPTIKITSAGQPRWGHDVPEMHTVSQKWASTPRHLRHSFAARLGVF